MAQAYSTVGARVLPWETLSALVQGESVIDLNSLPLRTAQEAYRFVKGYGYDVHHPADVQALGQLLDDSLVFLEQHLLRCTRPEDEATLGRLRLPTRLTQKRPDVLELLMLAAQPKKTELSLWSCALLKILHTQVHIEHTAKIQYAATAQQQILQQYQPVLEVLPHNQGVRLGKKGSPKQLVLAGVETKRLKTRESLLIKLLSKKANVIEEIDDLIGLRFITHQPADILLALDILMDNQLILFSNVNPNRSRNSLIALEDFEQAWEASAHPNAPAPPSDGGESPLLPTAIHTWQHLVRHLQSLAVAHPNAQFSQHNPHSAEAYRSLHITCRHLLRLPNNQAVGGHDERLFFPYELQFVDATHYQQNQEGEGDHAHYKDRQLRRSQRRVLGPLLHFLGWNET
jgi:uncharacterized protein (TIGR04552 family)